MRRTASAYGMLELSQKEPLMGQSGIQASDSHGENHHASTYVKYCKWGSRFAAKSQLLGSMCTTDVITATDRVRGCYPLGIAPEYEPLDRPQYRVRESA